MVQDTPVTDRDFAALFREEAGSILTEQQINDEIEREQTRSAQAARAGIAPNRFRGFNLQRYCKDIVRSHQPLSCLYLLLSDLTGAVSVLLPICCLLWVVRRLITFPLAAAYCVCAIVCVCFYGIPSICRRRLRTLLSGSVSDTTTLRQKAGRLQLISTVTAAILSFLLFFVYQSYFQQITKFASLQNIFLWFVSMMFLSGVHNVLYESHCISFFAVGWYTVAHQKSRTASAIRHYAESRGNTPLRPHLVTIPIYLLIALFIICILDFLCIRQCLMHFDYAVLTLGTVSTLCTLIGVISLISCIVLFRHCSKK
mgnify:FL=1